MPPQKRWLWPAADSKFLRHDNSSAFVYDSLQHHEHEVLVRGSDDELDIDGRARKRRRIRKLGKAFLNGRSLYISSACLLGPFGQAPKRQADHDVCDATEAVLHERAAVSGDNFGVTTNRNATLDAPISSLPAEAQNYGSPTCSPTLTMQDLRRQRKARESQAKSVVTKRWQSLSTRKDMSYDKENAGGATWRESPSDHTEVPDAHVVQQDDSISENFESAQETLRPREDAVAPTRVHHDLSITEARTENRLLKIPATAYVDTESKAVSTKPPQISDLSSSLPTPPSHHSPISSRPTRPNPNQSERLRDTEYAAPEEALPLSQAEQDEEGIKQARALSQQALHPKSSGIETPAQSDEEDISGPKKRVSIDADDTERSRSRETRSSLNFKAINVSATIANLAADAVPRTKPHANYQVATDGKSSPFLFRKNGEVSKAAAKDGDADVTGVELATRYANRKLPTVSKTNKERSILKRQLRREMRDSGASFVRNQDDGGSSMVDQESPDRRQSESHAMTLQPVLSTQAEMEFALNDLCRPPTPSTALKAQSPLRRSIRAETDSPRKHVITPFSKFNDDMPDLNESPNGPNISTQAMLDMLSPFPVPTAKKAKARKRASFATQTGSMDDSGSRAASAGDEVVSKSVSRSPSKPAYHATDQGILAKSGISPLGTSDDEVRKSIDPAFSKVLAESERVPDSHVVRSPKASKQTSSRVLSTGVSLGPSAFAQQSRGSPQASLSTPSAGSFRLSQIIQSVNGSRHTDINVHRLLNAKDGTPSSRSHKRGAVADWDISDESQESQQNTGDQETAIENRKANLPAQSDNISTNEQSPTKPGIDQKTDVSSKSFEMPPPSAPSFMATGATPATISGSRPQNAQRESSIDIDATIDDFHESVLGSWNVEKAMKQDLSGLC